jgi:BCCIP
VKSGEDEDPIGVASVLNLHRYRDMECLQQISAYLTKHCTDTKLKQQLNAVSIHRMKGNLVHCNCAKTRLSARVLPQVVKHRTGASRCGQRLAAESAAGECAAAGCAAAHAGTF